MNPTEINAKFAILKRLIKLSKADTEYIKSGEIKLELLFYPKYLEGHLAHDGN